VLAALLSLAAAEKILGRAEPIPSDKCGASVIASAEDRLYVFSLSEDSVVWYKFQKIEGGWSTWRPLADRKKMSSGPKPIRHTNGTVQVFARGADRKFYISTMTSLNEWSDWTSPFGDATFLSPPTPVVDASGKVRLFGVSTVTHSVLVAESSPITDGALIWSAWRDLGSEATGPVAVLIDAESLAHVFVRGVNRALWHLSETYSYPTGTAWGNWECLGGVMASAPKVPVSINGANLVEIYGRAADKALWHRVQTSGVDKESVEWAPWTSLGGVLASGPAVALGDDGLQQVFVRATDKAIYFKSQTQDVSDLPSFSNWLTLGGMFSTTPSVVVRADGFLDVFARGIDKAIWHTHQTENNGTRVFSSWHSLGGHTRKYTC
jgi:hypothetical protein